MEDDALLPISALEHLAYCPRQCALIHLDGVWIENVHTTAGRLVHERVDAGDGERRPGVRVVRSALLRCTRLGLKGIADVVEFHPVGAGRWQPYPVEYKRGARRQRDHDDVQLCAQAMALEEMLETSVPEGAIYHAKSKRRRVVKLDAGLRARTEAAARALHALWDAGMLPPAVHDARCAECSLREACQPELAPAGVDRLREALREALR